MADMNGYSAIFIIGAFIGILFSSWWNNNPTSSFEIYQEPAKLSDSFFVPPILLNKNTGQTWRFYRNIKVDDGTVSDEGWLPIMYKFADSNDFADTPYFAYKNYFRAISQDKRGMIKKYLGKDSLIDNIKDSFAK